MKDEMKMEERKGSKEKEKGIDHRHRHIYRVNARRSRSVELGSTNECLAI
jgi:hypothetical protein